MDLSKAQKTKIGKMGKEELQRELNEEEPSRFGQDSRWYIQKRLDEFLQEEERAEKERQEALREKQLGIAEDALAASNEAKESGHTAKLLSEQANLKSWIAVGISAVALVLAIIGLFSK